MKSTFHRMTRRMPASIARFAPHRQPALLVVLQTLSIAGALTACGPAAHAIGTTAAESAAVPAAPIASSAGAAVALPTVQSDMKRGASFPYKRLNDLLSKLRTEGEGLFVSRFVLTNAKDATKPVPAGTKLALMSDEDYIPIPIDDKGAFELPTFPASRAADMEFGTNVPKGDLGVRLSIDLATPPFRASPGASLLWSRLLPDDRLIQQFVGPQPIDDQVAGAMLQALSNLPSLEVPPAELLLAVLVGYILLIGPVSYLVLRRLDRRELAWITAPLLVAVFSVGTYGLGSSIKGSDIIVNEIDIVRSTAGGTAASVSSFAGVFSPTRASYDLTVRGDALFSGLRNIFVDGESTTPFDYATEQGDPSHLRGLAVSVFGLEAVRAETVIAYTPNLVVEWSFVPSGVEGRVTNEGEVPMEDVAVVSQSGGIMVGTLDPSESRAFALSLNDFGGAMASQQVYGFSSGNITTAAGRRIQARRQVIDALVGFSEGGFPGRLGNASGGIDAGPFVLGWQVDASPMPVEIDGHRVQRYAQSVEVLSGNPQFGPGTVRVEPSQMVTAMISSAGTVGEPEPGWVTIGEGEAVFQVSLPLEATGIVPSEVELIAGSDPGIIFFNRGNMQATLPRGYRLAAYDRVAGEWFDVGDLSLRSHFTVEQPARVLDRGNRILVRVTGSDIPKDFGQSTVFVSASVEGVI